MIRKGGGCNAFSSDLARNFIAHAVAHSKARSETKIMLSHFTGGIVALGIFSEVPMFPHDGIYYSNASRYFPDVFSVSLWSLERMVLYSDRRIVTMK